MESLSHHGIMGMRWGVRRYQNYDGSYTKKGLERYRKAESAYEQKKTDYKNGKATRTEVRKAKKELNRSYDRLKQDKLADQGKELYSKGKTINGNYHIAALSETAIVLGSSIANQVLRQYASQKVADISSALIAIGGTFVNGLIAAKNQSDAKKLRAYYTHHS